MRIAVVSDIHGNLPALTAVGERIEAMSVDLVVNLGDCASGPLWPAETVATLRASPWLHVRGNHDRQVGGSLDGRLGRSDSATWRALDASARAWLHGLPERVGLEDALFVHGAPGSDEAFLLEEIVEERLVAAREDEVVARLGGQNRRAVFCGHSHVPGLLALARGSMVVNPGSVGWPAYRNADPAYVSEVGSPHARFAVVDLATRPLDVELLAVSYDWDRAARRAEENGRDDWAYSLRTGLAPGG
ncbi:metallophosphoesterase family protein [Methylobacterium sp. WL103]|uniref:metallophosphoesterase family protein n=1 Tax=Methylobacterium sp. WL103 TaxID=2603891 RepID=UPI0011CA2BC2|nr:metallophosphoesterase family protein [Methylobacterium sp. WL103]TXN08380.1 metallophosphoesterase family protein [Methylobacterium sp. WL103]